METNKQGELERQAKEQGQQLQENVNFGSIENGVFMMDQDWYNYFYARLGLVNGLPLYLITNQPDKQDSTLHVDLYNFCNNLVYYIQNFIFTGQVNLQQFNAFMTELGKKHALGARYYNDFIRKIGATLQPQRAQTKKKKVQTQKKDFDDAVRRDDPIIDLAALSLNDKYKNLDDFKLENCNLVFIGHVDHGKSTLCGRILTDLDFIDEQENKRLEQEAKQRKMQGWKFAFVMDFDEIEMQKGKTVECAKSGFTLSKRRFTLIDSPGHKNYVPNMMSGACQADVAGLIVSASEGQFEAGFKRGGQTQQHAYLARSLGVHQLIVIVTKMATIKWDETRFKTMMSELTPFLTTSCGFSDFAVVPIDSLAGQNISKRIDKSVCSWYNGPCLFEVLDDIKLPQRNPLGHLRIPVIDCYRQQGQLYIYGKVEQGTIVQDQWVTLMPLKKEVLVKEIFDVRDQNRTFASAGQNIKLKVKDKGQKQQQEFKRGMIICNNQNICQSCKQFQAKITILQLPSENKILSQGFQCVIHMHSMMEDVFISKINAVQDPKTKKMNVTTFLRTGSTGIINIKALSPDVSFQLEKMSFMKCLGRFTLRSGSCTIGFGEVRSIKVDSLLTKQQKDQLVGQKKNQQVKQ